MSLGKRTFTLKTYGAKLYVWSPSDYASESKRKDSGGRRPYYCSATPGSQGQDWITTYVYNLTVVNGQQEKLGYVACDYVE